MTRPATLPRRLFHLAVVAALAPVACADAGGPVDTVDSDLREPPPSTVRTVTAPTLTIRVLQVASATGGGGDAVLVADSGGARPWHALVDAGGDGTAAAYLAAAGVDTLDLLVLTHAHSDHYGGMGDLARGVHVRRFVTNGQVRSAVTYQEVLAAVAAVSDTLVVPTVPWVLSLPGGGRAVILPPNPDHLGVDTDDGAELNDGSLAIRFELGTFSYLGTGDGETAANQRFVVTYPGWLDVEALKVGHHGSADATQSWWLEAVSPGLALVSANGTTHPHGSTLSLLEAVTPDLFCTPAHGIITVRVNKQGNYAVTTVGDVRTRCSTGSEAY